MIDFDYAAPTTIPEAIELLRQANGKARLLAGGTDLLVQLREYQKQAELVVDTKRIAELMALEVDRRGGLRIGASVPCIELSRHEHVQRVYSAVADAARIIGGWQIQSRASLGGNLCNASPAGDSIPALLAYQARCHVAGSSGVREIPIEAFCVGPGKTCLASDEILTAIELPPPPPQSGGRYLRFIPRNEMDIAVVGVGVAVTLDASGQRIEKARVALGAVAPTPVVAVEASEWLSGQPAVEATFVSAGERARAAAQPISDIRGPAEYRTHLVGVLVKRALADAVARARGQSVP